MENRSTIVVSGRLNRDMGQLLGLARIEKYRLLIFLEDWFDEVGTIRRHAGHLGGQGLPLAEEKNYSFFLRLS